MNVEYVLLGCHSLCHFATYQHTLCEVHLGFRTGLRLCKAEVPGARLFRDLVSRAAQQAVWRLCRLSWICHDIRGCQLPAITSRVRLCKVKVGGWSCSQDPMAKLLRFFCFPKGMWKCWGKSIRQKQKQKRSHHAFQVTWVPHHDLSAVEAALQAGAIFRWLDSWVAPCSKLQCKCELQTFELLLGLDGGAQKAGDKKAARRTFIMMEARAMLFWDDAMICNETYRNIRAKKGRLLSFSLAAAIRVLWWILDFLLLLVLTCLCHWPYVWSQKRWFLPPMSKQKWGGRQQKHLSTLV